MSEAADQQSMVQCLRVNIEELRDAYARGENIIQRLTYSQPELSRAEIIEIAYDIQAGSYSDLSLANPEALKRYAREIHALASPYLTEHDVFLDCGAGELTTLSGLSEHLPAHCELLACDISLSRLRIGRSFAERCMRADLAKGLSLFVADMDRLPLADCSVDVIFTSHALEPNHGRELALLSELLPITRRILLLFEPSWENNDEAGRARMQQHGYVRDLPQHIQAAGGRLLSVQPLPNPMNPLNPTYCYAVEPVTKQAQASFSDQVFHCPRSGWRLRKQHHYWWSQEGGWAYPEIDGIACLREKHGVLMSHA